MWHLMPRLMGAERRLPWICAHDLGAIAAHVFANPQQFVGKDLTLASDVQSLAQCRSLYREVIGAPPPEFPMPTWLFQRFGFAGRDLMAMWRWLRTGDVDLDTAATREIHPGALTVRAWLGTQKAARPASR
jgi:hypothetical protein